MNGSDLARQLQALAEKWRSGTNAIQSVPLCADELDALVRAASPLAPQLDNDVKAEVMPSDSANERLESSGSTNDHNTGVSVDAGAQHPAENTAQCVDTDVVRGRIDGAAGGVRSAGPPQADDPPQRWLCPHDSDYCFKAHELADQDCDPNETIEQLDKRLGESQIEARGDAARVPPATPQQK